MRDSYLFCGVGGSGMSALAQILAARGVDVHGSDRAYDQGKHTELFAMLKELGVTMHPQDGSGITESTTRLVVSSAVEDTIPDVKAAKGAGVNIIHRADVSAAPAGNRRLPR
jgi:UDP-N-acetylmuramate--alanine ligase